MALRDTVRRHRRRLRWLTARAKVRARSKRQKGSGHLEPSVLIPTTTIFDIASTRLDARRGMQLQVTKVHAGQSSAGIDEQINQLLMRQMTEALLPKSDSKAAGSSSQALDRARTMLADALSGVMARTFSQHTASPAREPASATGGDTP